MHEIKEIWAFGPLFTVGFLLVGTYSALTVVIYLRLRRNGYRYGGAGMLFGIFDQRKYLSVRAKHGWPVWPVLVMWPCLILGVILMATGLFKH
jgi:hypothetical protein